uniref:Uncharacterized protein n=1 Tax=Athene cunicularia TaxID=194338 RepID=A0A663MJP6_ATHCN
MAAEVSVTEQWGSAAAGTAFMHGRHQAWESFCSVFGHIWAKLAISRNLSGSQLRRMLTDRVGQGTMGNPLLPWDGPKHVKHLENRSFSWKRAGMSSRQISTTASSRLRSEAG